MAKNNDLPTTSYDKRSRCLVVYPYHRHDIAGLLRRYDPVSIALQGDHDNVEALADLETLEKLDIRNSKFDDLTLLENVRIADLLLNHTRVEDLTPLVRIEGLEELSLWANKRIIDYRCLTKCQSLKRLALYSCHDVRYPSFPKLKTLTHLNLDCCSGVSRTQLQRVRSRVEVDERKVEYA